MSADVTRRCGCRDENGRQLGTKCPRLSDPKHGTWSYSISAGFVMKPGADGKLRRARQRVRIGGFKTQKAAQTARNKAAVQLDQGNYREPSKETLAEYLTTWLPRRERTGNGLKVTTVRMYRRYIEVDIGPSKLGSMKISEIRRGHVTQFVDALTDAGRGATTVRRIVAVLQSAFRDAANDQLIDDNPAHGVRLPTVERDEFQPWEPEQIGHFLDVAAKHRLGELFTVAVFCGMRRGELVGLRWEDVDLAKREIAVKHTRVQAGKETIETSPKSRAGRRIIELDDTTVGALIAWQIKQTTERETWGEAWTDSGYVFTYENGTPLRPAYASRLFESLRDQAQLEHASIHSLRHTHASLLLASGTDIAIVSKRLGHSTVALTSDVYAHLIASASRRAAEGAAALVPRATVHTAATHEVESPA
ncbi:site-specific integrase [Microbacterium capsulatum]|uniref:Site-specific integrase n=1 Tax=Microbacterium capsulatum TaxID=3041921 RepID=A0ABU0XGI9_9MICO|nr:site-specific integrase [Microbacterium sp. ASV81]MDQ4213784.1 site-specific integrase [Microbacterium sp. ASV81]